ncbi:Rv3654c family TadE-like protein [Propionibacterium freudenreichii]|uniref:Rv3654c family TadE-like protein n=1 Tax=Propionibacterium freudenreichii TaxID=1744 RepID=UPI00288B668D|nr:Rv3654c family TadE-like protein [Propionibacterium freudenreichii]
MSRAVSPIGGHRRGALVTRGPGARWARRTAHRHPVERHGVGPRVPGRSDERGSGSVLALIIVLVTCVVAYWTVVFAGWVGSIHRARSAADMASLAGAHALQVNGDACSEARRIATSNGAELTDCTPTRGIGEYVVEVTIAMPPTPSLPGAPSKVRETSTAGEVQR